MTPLILIYWTSCISIGQLDSRDDEFNDPIKGLQSNDVDVRRGSAGSLALSKPPDAIPALLKALNDTDAVVRQKAASAFNQNSKNASKSFRDASKPAIPILGGLLIDKEVSVRRSAASALFSLGTLAKESVPALTKAMNDTDKFVRISSRAAVAGFLTGEEGEKALRSLLEFSDDEDAEVRRAALDVFTYIGVRAVPILKDGLKDKNPVVRGWTIGALAAVMRKKTEKAKFPAEAIKLLADAINDENNRVAQGAMYAVSQLGPAAKEAVPVIVKRFKDPDWQMRQYAIMMIEEFGSSAESAIPALKDSLNDANDNVRLAAKRALDTIEKALGKDP